MLTHIDDMLTFPDKKSKTKKMPKLKKHIFLAYVILLPKKILMLKMRAIDEQSWYFYVMFKHIDAMLTFPDKNLRQKKCQS